MYWRTTPTTYRIGETTKPFGSSGSGAESDAYKRKQTDKESANYPETSEDKIPQGKNYLDEAEATAREYCRRRNAGKSGLRKF